MKKILFVFLFFILSIGISFSQILTQRYNPGEAVKNGLKVKRQNLHLIEFPKIETEKLLKDDEEMKGDNVPFRFGYAFNVSYTLEDGEWTDIDGGRLWSLSFKSKDAYSLNFVFEDFTLPHGAYLNIVNSNESIVYGPVTTDNIPQDKFFLTDIIPDSLVSIYVYEPSSQIGKSTLTIKKVVHGYRDYSTINDNLGNVGNSANCNIPVEDEFPNYEKESNAIALILLEDGTSLCSGSLIMSTDMSFKPYLLTAFHCINTELLDLNEPTDTVISYSENTNVNHWAIKFGFRQQSSYAITFNGAIYRAGWFNSDFALVELYEDVKQFTHLTWLGWDRTGNTPTSGVGIHHPKGDYMKIAIDNDILQESMWISSVYPNNMSQHWVTHWDEGIVQRGSSGSPLLNQDNRIVGQLHGVVYEVNHNEYTPPCDIDYGYYGKFNLSWTGGGHDYDRLSNWLDPIGTNQTTIDSYNPIRIAGSSSPCDNPVYSVTNLPAGYSVDWSLSPDVSILGTSILTTDIPQQNQCTIDSYDLVPWVTSLRADVKNAAGDTIVTLSKVIRNTFDVTFTQTGGTIGGVTYPSIGPSTVSSTGTIAVNHRCGVSVESPFFDDMTISHSGASPSFFGVFDGSINFVFPTVASTQYMTITGRDGCRIMQLNVQVIPNPNIPIPMLEISPTANGYEIQLVWVGDDDAVRERTRSVQNTVWELNIVNATSGEAVECLRVKGDRTTISTTGWKPGAYVLQAFIDGQRTTMKMLVK